MSDPHPPAGGEPAPRPCPHCGHMADTLIVVKRITTYERHAIDYPVIGEAGRP
jgi:hypothetical protein